MGRMMDELRVDCGVSMSGDDVREAIADFDAVQEALRALTRAGEETVTAGHPTGSLLKALVWAQGALRR